VKVKLVLGEEKLIGIVWNLLTIRLRLKPLFCPAPSRSIRTIDAERKVRCYWERRTEGSRRKNLLRTT